MSKYDTVDEMLMEQELNSKVFRSDPLKKISDDKSRVDRFNNKYLIELKCRYKSIDKIKQWGGATIERDKYRALMRECGDKTPGYINKFPCGSYYGWNLKKIKEPSWYEKMYNISTVENKGLRPKIVGDLQFEDGKKINMRVLIILILLTGCVKDYDLNPYTTVMRFIVNEKK